MGHTGAASAVRNATRAARAGAAVVVLSLLFALSMGLVHVDPGGRDVTEHVHEAVSAPDEASGAHDHQHQHGDPVDGGAGSSVVFGGAPSGDAHQDDAHHHHLVDVDAGVVLEVLVAAPHRTGPLRPLTAGSVPASLSDGGGRPD